MAEKTEQEHMAPEPAIDLADEKAEAFAMEDIIAPKSDVEGIQFTPEEEAAVIRKLDWHIVPLLVVLYSLSVLDRTNLGNARIAGLSKDINLGGKRYDWLGTIFYISYILFQWAQIGWKAFPPHIWVAFVVFAWGTISTCQAAANSWGTLMALRFLLAIAEAMYGPGVPLYLSYFYPREKLGLRVGIFLAGSAAANAYGSALAYGISQIKGSIGPWRILFIIEGLPSIVCAVIAYFTIADSPRHCKFLSEREKEIAVAISERQPGDRSGAKGLRWKQLAGALMDYRSYPPPLMYFGCNVAFASLPLFIPTIISEMGSFSTIQSNGLSAPPYVLTFFIMIGTSFVSDRYKIRGPFIMGAATVSAIGYIMLAASKRVAVRYTGIMLTPVIFTSSALILSWVANTHPTESRRAGALAILATGGQTGPVLGTNIFPIKDKPYYHTGMWTSAACCFTVVFFAGVQMSILHWENKKRDKKYGKDREVVFLDSSNAFGDDERFRYML